MSTKMEFKVAVDNTELIKHATREAVKVALEAVGLQAEGYAKRLCPVDTGLLRNSITHAVGGISFASSYSADRPTSGGAMKGGFTSGTIGGEDDLSAYIGTNVEYAAYVEYGTVKSKAQAFIKPAVNDHTSEYQKIFETYLKNA